jgi:hypothetical protein
MAKAWVFAILILVFLVQCAVANGLEMEAWRENMESRLLKLERENSQLAGTVIQLKRENEEQDKTINLLTEQNKRLTEAVSEVRTHSEPTISMPRNDSATPLNTFGALGKVQGSTYENPHNIKRNIHAKREY